MTRRALGLWALVALLWFGTLGVRPLYKADESRYGEISREMLASGDWVTPRLNGYKYFEKPPLQYWATAALFAVFGVHDWVARLWSALLGFAGIVLAYRVANRLRGPPHGLYAAAILASSPLYVLLGQVNTLDMGVAFFLAAAMFAAALGRWLLFWAACAAAVLSKGLIGIVLPLAALGLFTVVKKDWRLPLRARPVAGMALFLAIAAPWFFAVSAANAEFAHFFFIQEHFQRFTTEMHQRVQPAWYFVPVLLAGFAPWLVPLGAAAWRRIRGAAAPRELHDTAGSREPGGASDAEVLLWCWVAVVFVFFSASGSKLPPYILPLFPALAVLAAPAIGRTPLVVQGVVLAPVVLVAGIALQRFAAGGRYEEYSGWLLAATLLLALAAAAAALLAWRARQAAAVLALAAGSLVATQLGLAAHLTLADRFSIATTVARLPERPPEGVPVFAVDMYDHTLPWTLERTVTMVRHRDELAVAIGWEPHRFVPDLAAFASAWQAAPQAWAVLRPGDAERLQAAHGIRMQVLAAGEEYVIARKP